MRNQALMGYLLHHRPYQENRALYVLFTNQYGVVHGVGKKGMPLFTKLQLFATGKQQLKTFSQLQILAFQPMIMGANSYAALYLNEILSKLLAIEDPAEALWQAYDESLACLRQPLTPSQLRLCLRQFERQLFMAMGVLPTMYYDHKQQPIQASQTYLFFAEIGFMALDKAAKAPPAKHIPQFSGKDLLAMAEQGLKQGLEQQLDEQYLYHWAVLHRHIIDHLLDYQPLKSRQLWQQQYQYSTVKIND